MTEEGTAGHHGGKPGRPITPVGGPEPGRSYISALRRWPDEIAGIKRGELAEHLGMSPTSLSDKLRNHDRWQATDSQLDSALKIIEACGGTKADCAQWKAYHDAVRNYQRDRPGGEPPQPPEPVDQTTQDPSEPEHGRVTDAPRLPAPIQSDGDELRRMNRDMVGALSAVALLVIGAVVWISLSSPAATAVRIKVFANSDELVTTPLLRDVMGNYATALPITEVPPPPGGRDSCSNRHQWAHSAPINGVDVGASVAKVDITALESDITVDRAALHLDQGEKELAAKTMLACPGGGGTQPPHLMTVNLDSGKLEFFPDGGDQPGNFNLRIPKGQTDSILLIGSALNSYGSWRLELGGDNAENSFEYTVGPDGAVEGRATSNPQQRPFVTVGEFLTNPYRFRDGTWQPGR